MLDRAGQEEAATQRRLVILAALLPPPVSLDILTEVGGASPVATLGRLESLVRAGVLKPCAQGGVGHYQLGDPAQARELIAREAPGLVRELAQALVRHLAQAAPPPRGPLAIANVCHLAGLKMADVAPLKQAADYCLGHGAREAAAIYYRLALEARERTSAPSDRDKADFVASALGMVAACGHLMPLERQEATLLAAQDHARELGDQASLCKIDLTLGQIRKLRADYRGAGQLFEEAWRLAVGLDRADLLKEAALFSDDFLFWQAGSPPPWPATRKCWATWRSSPRRSRSCAPAPPWAGATASAARPPGAWGSSRRCARRPVPGASSRPRWTPTSWACWP